MRLGYMGADGGTRLATLRQSGAARVRFPKPPPGRPPEAVLLNMAGGLTGGDKIDVAVALGAGCEATLTTAAAEKVYRSLDGETDVDIALEIAAGATCSWLPQPTILFDGARLERRTRVRMAASARLLAAEMLVYGRTAMGEDVRRGAVCDSWRIVREGRLVFADTTRVAGNVGDVLDRPATLGGARAMAIVLYVASDADQQLEAVRALLDAAGSEAGASAWNGVLVVRAAARTAQQLQHDLEPVIVALSGGPLPRVWQC